MQAASVFAHHKREIKRACLYCLENQEQNARGRPRRGELEHVGQFPGDRRRCDRDSEGVFSRQSFADVSERHDDDVLALAHYRRGSLQRQHEGEDRLCIVCVGLERLNLSHCTNCRGCRTFLR